MVYEGISITYTKMEKKNFESRANHQTKRDKILKQFLKRITLIVYDNQMQEKVFAILLK